LQETYRNSYDGTFKYLDGKVQKFHNNWKVAAKESSDARIEFDRAQAELLKDPNSALRQADAAKMAKQLQEAQVLQANSALEEMMKASKFNESIFSSKGPFSNEYKFTKAFSELSKQGIPQSAVKTALNIQTPMNFSSDQLQSINAAQAALDSYNQKATETAAKNNAIGQSGNAAKAGFDAVTGGANAASVKPTIQETQTGLNQISGLGGKAADSVKTIGGAFQQVAQDSQASLDSLKSGINAIMDQVAALKREATGGLMDAAGGALQGFSDGKFDPLKAMVSALPGLAKAFFAKLNENHYGKLGAATKQGLPKGGTGGFGGSRGSIVETFDPKNSVFGSSSNLYNQKPTVTVTANTTTATTNIDKVKEALETIPDFKSSTIAIDTTLAIINVDRVSEALNKLPPETTCTIKVDNAAALSAIQAVSSQLDALDGRTVTSYVNTVSTGGGGFGGGGLFGGGDAGGVGPVASFSQGGYTGNGGIKDPAGIVHGREFVMPADATAKYRPILEAMRSGRSVTQPSDVAPVGSTSPNMNVSVHNYGSSQIAVEQLSPTDIRIIAREEVQKNAGKVVAASLSNPNSKVSRSMQSNTQTRRRR
jgi:hypothetical protein